MSTKASSTHTSRGPLFGIRVIEFTHMVMGPAVGAVLVELGATVIRIEPLAGDATRHLPGSGAGYFAMYNRNKKSVCLDLKSSSGLSVAKKLINSADVVIENFKPGTMARLGLDYETLSAEHPRLIYCSEKGFLSGPYQERTALDEVTQMMGGLAYMTGLPGKPMRAGTSVIDVTGGMFGAIGILSAVIERQQTGRGQHVVSALFETTVYLIGQHMAQYAVTGRPAQPMSIRTSAWAIYDVFQSRDNQSIFIGVVSDALWKKFCQVFSLSELGADPQLARNAQRVEQRERVLPIVRECIALYSLSELTALLQNSGIPFAPIGKPEDMFDDPHLLANGSLGETVLPNGKRTRLPNLPLELNGHRPSQGGDLAQPGEHSADVLKEIGYSDADIEWLKEQKVLA